MSRCADFCYQTQNPPACCTSLLSRDTQLLPVQLPLHHATEIASCYSGRKASRSALLPRAVHEHTKVMNGILKSSLFKYSRKTEEEEGKTIFLYYKSQVISHYTTECSLMVRELLLAGWRFLQKCTINALDRQNHLTPCKQQNVTVSRQQKEC